MMEQSAHVSERAEQLRLAFDQGFTEVRHFEAQETEDLLSVEVGGDLYMLRLAEITGFVADKKVTRLPSNTPELSGIAGFRGAIMPVYDLAALLHYPPSRSASWMVVAAAAPIALAFDGFDGHHRFAADEIIAREGAEAGDPVRQVVRSGQFVRPIIIISSIVDAIARRVAVDGSAQET